MTEPHWADEPQPMSVTPIDPPEHATPTYTDMLKAGIVTGVSAGLACLLIWAVARLAGVSFDVQAPGRDVLSPVPWYVVALVPLLAALLGVVVAGLFLGVRRGSIYVRGGGFVVAVVSLVSPLAQPVEVSWATRLVLASMHLVTYLIVVPQVARVVADSDPARRVRHTPAERA